jgi:hypothetical protein
MREEFKSDAWRDFKQRYEGTYGWYEKDNGETILVNLRSVEGSAAVFQDAAGVPYTARPDRGNMFQFLPLERSVYNTKDDVIYCYRVPQRQWKRGLCDANTSFVSLSRFTYTAGPTFELLAELFGAPDTTRLSAFKEKGEGATALNSVFSIINNQVMCFSHKIGTYQKGIATLYDKLFEQELNDLVRQHQFPFVVEVAK